MSPEILDIIIGVKKPRNRWRTVAIPTQDGRGLKRQRRTIIDKACRLVIFGYDKDCFDYYTHVAFQPYVLGQKSGGLND